MNQIVAAWVLLMLTVSFTLAGLYQLVFRRWLGIVCFVFAVVAAVGLAQYTNLSN